MEFSQFAVATTAIHVLIGATAILSIASLSALALTRSSAALRHRIWSLSVGAVLLLPGVVAWAPQWRLGWLDEALQLDEHGPGLAVHTQEELGT